MLFRKKERKMTESDAVYTVDVKEYGDMSAEERLGWHPVNEKYEKVPKFCKISFIILAASLTLYILACISTGFADLFNKYVSSAFRIAFATVTNILPFSLAELIVLLLPVIAFISIWYLIKYRCDTRRSTFVAVTCILAIASIFLSTFLLCFGTAYKGSTLDKKLGIKSEAVEKQELYEASDILVEKVNELSSQIRFADDGFSIMPYSFDEMNEKLLEAYDRFCEKNSFIFNFNSRLKPVMMSEALSYMHITGVYTFFTGESNINVGFPDYNIPYTSAHELAHQRGVAREDEANMVAFLVCMESDDPYIQYSAYLNMYEYVSSALYSADRELYKEIRQKLSPAVYSEQVAYSRFFDKYSDSVASKVSGAVNDAYLKTQGTEGRVSYGMVVDLTVAYFKNQGLIKGKSN